jgi:hypothetical protein
MADDETDEVYPAERRPALHHWAGFLVSGLIAL